MVRYAHEENTLQMKGTCLSEAEPLKFRSQAGAWERVTSKIKLTFHTLC